MSDSTQILGAIHQGDPHASSELLLLVYHELRRLASSDEIHLDGLRAGGGGELPGHWID
jgi:hypothetical protein